MTYGLSRLVNNSAAMPPDVRRNIGFRPGLSSRESAGDVKKLSGKAQLYRLRVGTDESRLKDWGSPLMA